jgi:hypothetical protein
MRNPLAFSICIALSLLSLTLARAESGADESSPLTKVEGATITCKDEYQLYAIDAKNKRIWASDPGVEEGMELKVSQFKIAKCPNCIDIDATLDFLGETSEMHFKLRGVTASYSKATLSVQAKQENGKMEELSKLDCETVAKKQ